MNRSTIILAAVAGLLLAYILIFERDTVTTHELELREGRVLPRFIRKRVSRIEIERAGEKLVLERKPAPELDDQLGIWRMLAPVKADADQEAVETLLGELEWMDARRRLTDIGAEDRKRFGLSSPRVRVGYQVGKEHGQLLLGAESPMGDGHYVQADDPAVAFVVGKDLFEALDHPAAHYHTKELHSGLLLATVNHMKITLAGHRLAFERRDGRMWLTAPQVGWADETRLYTFTDTLDRLVATRYVGERPKGEEGMARYGLDRPTTLDAVIDKRTLIEGKDGAKDTFDNRTLRLRVGAPCEGHPDERYFTAEDIGGTRPILCVALAELQPALDALAQPREERLLTLRPERIGAIELAEGGQRLRVERRADGWHYRLERKGEAKREGEAEQGSVEAWLGLLGAARAHAFDQGAASGGPVGAPDISARFELKAGQGTKAEAVSAVELAVFERADAVMVRRGDEPELLAFDQGIVTPLRASVARFRSHKLLALPETALVALTITRDGAQESLVRAPGGALTVVRPIETPADSILGPEVVRQLTALEAAQFVSDAPAPEHGLPTGAARASLSVRFKVASDGGEAAEHRLAIGAPAEPLGGFYAQFDRDPAVFVLPAQLVEKLRRPLASRTALSVPLADLKSLSIDGDGRRCELAATGTEGAFAFAGQPVSATAKAVAEALATLRVDTLLPYGTPPPQRRVRLELVRADGAPRAITIGAQAEDGHYPAQLDGLALVYGLSQDQYASLTSCPEE